MQRILCTNASSVSMHSLKTLSIDIDLAESVFNRKIFIRESRGDYWQNPPVPHLVRALKIESLRASLIKEDPSNDTTVTQTRLDI